MSDARALLERISAFRQRIEQQTGPTPIPLPTTTNEANLPLEQRTQVASRQQAMLERTLRSLTSMPSPQPNTGMPTQLTARARRLLEESKSLVLDLRKMADQPLLIAPLDPNIEIDPLVHLYRETVAMTEAALRLVGTFPDTPSVQLRLCDGVDGILSGVRSRLASVQQTLTVRQRDVERLDTLAGLLCAVENGQLVDIGWFEQLGESLLADAGTTPLRVLATDPHVTQDLPDGLSHAAPARYIACHSLNVAQVVAHLVRIDPDWRSAPLIPIMTALMQDVGMLRVPVELLATPGAITEEERRMMEAHPRIGAELVTVSIPGASHLADAIATHHERLDGTGYPLGLKGEQIAITSRLLAVADVYAAMSAPRPYRSALDPRTALTDTLMMSEDGLLDRTMAEKLLALSFYPVGSIVELSDGSIGMVVAVHRSRYDISAPLKPVIAVLTTPQGELMPYPRHLNLAESDEWTIVKAVSREKRRQLLGKRYPEWS